MTMFEVLSDGSVRIVHEGQVGIVSSWHLVEPKLAQLREAAEKAQEPQGEAPPVAVH